MISVVPLARKKNTGHLQDISKEKYRTFTGHIFYSKDYNL